MPFSDGVTIHTGLGFKFGFNTPLSDKKLAKLREDLSELKLIIIDEFSLVGSDMLVGIHKRLCEIFCSEDLFANKSVLLVGDILQLKPVNASFIFNEPKDEHLKRFNEVAQVWQSFEPYVLTVNHRQAESRIWANFLNELRKGHVSEEALELLQTRITDESFLDQSAMHVMYTNAEVKEHNLNMLDTLSSEEVQIPAIKVHPTWYKPTISYKDGSIDITNYLDTLVLKVGARVSLVFNISLIDNLVNGSLGTVVGIKTKGDEVTCIMIAFDDPNAGQRQREKYPNLSKEFEDQNGTPIFRHELEYTITAQSGKAHSARAKVIQFPLRLSYASTAHKMQVHSHELKLCVVFILFTHHIPIGTNCQRRIQIDTSLGFKITCWHGLCNVRKM